MKNKIAELIAEIQKTKEQLERLEFFYEEHAKKGLEHNKSIEKTVFLSEIFANYYTCLETVFFRISQFFENSLPPERWHAELLNKMRLEISDIRIAVISEESYRILDEFRKFRHFKRYYYSMDYDWDKILYLSRKFEKLRALGREDLNRFTDFLNRLSDQ